MSLATDSEVKKQLAHILWIGGATDSGKSTVAGILAERWDVPVYHFDRADVRQSDILARNVPEVSQFLQASLEERWIQPAPKTMFEHLLLIFPHRFRLVIEDLLGVPQDQTVIVEGFGLLPGLVHPVLSSPNQGIWFVPTDAFKWASMLRRNKPSFASQVSDPEKARMNLFARDKMLADYYRQQVPAYGFQLLEIDSSRPVEEVTQLVEIHFLKYMTTMLSH
jgi:adenylate kinase family enzyme